LRLGLELDVRRSKDGVLGVLHDATLDRTTDGTGRVAAWGVKDLKKLDAGRWFDRAFAGARVPTLAEGFALVKARGHRDTLGALALRVGGVEADVVRLASEHGVLSRVVCIGTAIDSPAVRRRLRAAAPQVPVAVLAQAPADLPKALADPT